MIVINAEASVKEAIEIISKKEDALKINKLEHWMPSSTIASIS